MDEWSVPCPALAHQRLLGLLRKPYARLWILNYETNELANGSEAGSILLMPSIFLIWLCRVPFVPFDVVRWVRRRRLAREEYRSCRDFYYKWGELSELA